MGNENFRNHECGIKSDKLENRKEWGIKNVKR